MKKIVIFFFLFLVYDNALLSKNKSNFNFIGCQSKDHNFFNKNYYNLQIKKIEIDINNYKKWTINNIKILTNPSRFTPDTLKKRFKAKVVTTFEDNTICISDANIRHSGDAKDHIQLVDNNLIQSLDVNLANGNIKGITKFKLFEPNARGNLEDVILQNQLLRNFGYLAPRSFKVNARVNENNSIMLFQEKAAKELLEYNKRREGPIYEGDQKYFFNLVKDIPDNNLSNWSVGTPFLRNKTMKVMLGKSTNPDLIFRSENHKKIFFQSLSNLNFIYLYWSNRFQDQKNNYFFFDYDLDNHLLAFNDKKKILKLDFYNLFLQSTNSHHGLGPDARKFYWNSLESYFEPILYDANPNINANFSSTTTSIIRYPISDSFYSVFDILENKIKSIDKSKLYSELKSSGLEIKNDNISLKLNKILSNLKKIKLDYLEKKNENLINHNKYKKIDNLLSNFFENIQDIDPNLNLVIYDSHNDNFMKCKNRLTQCENFLIKPKQILQLIEGDLKIDNINYQFLGDIQILNTYLKRNKTNHFQFLDVDVYYEDGIEIYFDNSNSTLNFNQKKIGSRVMIANGNIDNFSINFFGIQEISKQPISKPINFPIDINYLTGCLTFLNLNLNNVEINSYDANCEDGVNLINVNGNIKKITIKNAYQDGFDSDFSNIDIKNTEIDTVGNDCMDVSEGVYKLENITLKNCIDKGLSIGEKSTVHANLIFIKNSNIGIASKDSSVTTLSDIKLEEINVCLSAYNKKQEFLGGIIYANNTDLNFCKEKKIEIDNYSTIILN